MTPLHPYQVTGAKFLAARTAALLADDMGLGKSAQAIAACDALDALDVVVVCPASVVENWRREFVKFSTQPRVLLVLSYEKAARPETLAKLLAESGFDVLVIDEAHFAKTPSAKRTQMLYGLKTDGEGGLVSKAKHVFLLTGTPAPNNPSELWTHLRALAPETILGSKSQRPMSFWQFVNAYCTTRDNGFGTQITGGKRHEVLKEKLQPFMLRRLKSEVLADLPPITWGEVFVEGKLTLDWSASAEATTVAAVLEAKGVDGLREIAPHVATLRRLTGLAKVAPVIEWVEDFVAGGEKLVVFAHHKEVLHGILSGLEAAGIGYTGIDGSHSSHQRQLNVDAFQTRPEIRVFLGQIQAAGVGITLTAASDVLFVESSWVPAENSQAAMRIHRIGQANPCLIRFAVLAGSIDEQIAAAVARKTRDITKILG